MRLARTLTALSLLCVAAFVTAPMAAAQASPYSMTPEQIAAMMPSKSEMRQGLVEAGMTPAQIEQILSGMDFPNEASNAAPVANGLTKTMQQPCDDVNDNDICDNEEGDPAVSACRTKYLNVVTKYSEDLYRGSLGKTPVRVAQTCSMAAVGGTMYYGQKPGSASASSSPAWYHNMDDLMSIAAYWDQIMAYANYLDDGYGAEEVVDNMSDAELERRISQFPPDLQRMMRGHVEGSGASFRNIALPVHNKCEVIRRRVGSAFRQNVLDYSVCTTVVPDAAIADFEGEEGLK
ncbi:hypothetical protein [Fretibacter rubidus]|uniref:hypothetical protein n=1 Tax=Fretibacter rubidus TaxID=570162 RepID=UPI00352B4C36